MRYWYPCLNCKRAVIGVMPAPCYFCKTGKSMPKKQMGEWTKISETADEIVWLHKNGVRWHEHKYTNGYRKVIIKDDKLIYKMEDFDPR